MLKKVFENTLPFTTPPVSGQQPLPLFASLAAPFASRWCRPS